ncbi:MAG TPA: choice-of-anchor Q domain-containing protein, partial [Thermomicrobiales bacterium]|nr:choice-of-anchor Q domain-containing protein [Thermomicrobiales bacterium]
MSARQYGRLAAMNGWARTARTLLCLTILLAASLAAVAPRSALAATFTVTNLNDSGDGSLREALADAALLAGPDTIEFDDGLVGSIVLTSGTLLLDSDVTIDGHDRITLDGNNATSVITVGPGVTAMLTRLTISNGRANRGGGIYNDGVLTLIESTVSDNRTPTAGVNSDRLGGGIYNSMTGSLTLTGSTVSGNVAGVTVTVGTRSIGGGVFNDGGTLTMTGSDVSFNRVVGRGGGIANVGTATLIDSTVSDNEAFSVGGILNGLRAGDRELLSGSATLTGVTVARNTGSTGGGIANDAGTVTLTDSFVVDNVQGGGIRNQGMLTMSGTTVSRNTNSNPGGGVDNNHLGTATLTNCTVSDNVSDLFGGGIDNDGILTLTDSLVSHNRSDRWGGGIHNNNSVGLLTLIRSTVSFNTTTGDGGGIYSQYNDLYVLTLEDSTVSNNTAAGDGGGFFTGDGGGIFTDEGRLVLLRSAVTDNTAAGDGGGIYSNSYGDGFAVLTLTESTVADNSAGLSGGGVYLLGELLVASSSVSGNEAVDGGGISIADNGIPFRPANGSATLTDSTISGNIASGSGGGLFNDGSLTLSNSTLSGNEALDGAGLFNAEAAAATLTHGTIFGNIASVSGGGISNVAGIVEAFGTIVAGNSDPPATDCAGSVASLGYNLDGDGSCFSGGGTDLPSTNPLLGPLADNGGPTLTHLPDTFSPAVNAIPPGACVLPTDQRGVPRSPGNACDIGSVELEQPVEPINTAPVVSADQTSVTVNEGQSAT